ncbi:MAG: DUF1365 domain-containing protein [Alsobacter sp.]
MSGARDSAVRGFPPPAAAASLYRGDVMHARMKPVPHRFTYSVFNLLIDLGRLDEASRCSRLFSVNRRNLLSFHEIDHGPRDGGSLLAHARGLFAEAGVDISGGRVLLLCYPRLLGLVFNPLSVYYAYGEDGALVGVIYEVRNTFGEHHSYVAPVEPGELSAAGLRQERAKLFYVSPFNGMAMRYLFRLRPPTDAISVRILETDGEGPLLAATFKGERKPLTTRELLAALGAVPLLTATVVAGIHWEALKLWLKGLRLVPRPAPPPAVSFGDGSIAPRPASVRAGPAPVGVTPGPATSSPFSSGSLSQPWIDPRPPLPSRSR